VQLKGLKDAAYQKWIALLASRETLQKLLKFFPNVKGMLGNIQHRL